MRHDVFFLRSLEMMDASKAIQVTYGVPESVRIADFPLKIPIAS
jgi:hypothetical protein